MNNTDLQLFDFDDLLIEPAHISPIRSRKEVTPKHSNGYYPLMTAPMDTVICKENHNIYKTRGIVPVLPRGQMYFTPSIKDDGHFTSYGLDEFNEIFLNGQSVEIPNNTKINVLIDVANGHMRALYESAKTAKEKYGDQLVLMVGNVANPKTFAEYCMINVDYVRIGIGNGNGCLTTVQTGVGFPMASLIQECYDIKKYMNFPDTKIVADGGFKKYSDVIKAIGLGADYVMLGSIFNKALESSGETTREDGTVIDQFGTFAHELFNSDTPLYKTFRGMSTKEVQKAWGREEFKTSEGVVRKNKVEYTIDGWIENFDSYLRSAMSYTGHKELRDFIGGVHMNLISQNAFKRFDK